MNQHEIALSWGLHLRDSHLFISLDVADKTRLSVTKLAPDNWGFKVNKVQNYAKNKMVYPFLLVLITCVRLHIVDKNCCVVATSFQLSKPTIKVY